MPTTTISTVKDDARELVRLPPSEPADTEARWQG